MLNIAGESPPDSLDNSKSSLVHNLAHNSLCVLGTEVIDNNLQQIAITQK